MMAKNTTLRTAALAAILSVSVSLSAQDSGAVTEDDSLVFDLEAFEVEATGFAQSIEASTEIKKRAPLIVEAVTAEDIGKLPDTSIAETLARLPGLTTQRINSRAQGIVIRGLVGDFSTGLLNGRQQVSTNAGRGIEFDQYPAELLNGVMVYKTTQANLVGQGLAGTIDMRTARPLEHGRRTVAVNAFYEWADLGKLNPDGDDTGLRYSMNYIDQFNDGTLGIAIGYAHTDQPGQGEQWNAWGYAEQDDGSLLLGGAKPFVRSSNLERDSIMGVIEYKPSDKFRAIVDLFYSDFGETQILRGVEMPINPGWGTGTTILDSTVEDGLITRATIGDFFGVARNDIVWRDAEVKNAGINLRFGDGSGWVYEADLSTSRVDRTDNVLETYMGWGSNKTGTPDTITLDMGTGTGAVFSSELGYSSSDMFLASPQGWGGDAVEGGQVGFLKGPITEDELDQYKILAKRDMDWGIFNKFETGLAYTERGKFEVEAGPNGKEGFHLGLASGQPTGPLPPNIGFADLSFLGLGNLYAFDPRAALESGLYDLVPNDNPSYVANNWTVEEEVTTAYIQFGIDMKLGSIPVTGSIGTQLIMTDQYATGLAATGTLITPVADSHDYEDWVPSVNLAFELSEKHVLRLSIARQLARQAMVDMRAGSTYGFDEAKADSTDVQNSPWSGNGGNPKLEPWRSNSFDVSFENYFADNKGYWALAAFYKDLVSYTYNESILTDFSGYPTGVEGVTPAIYEGYRTIPNNGQGGSIKGLELTLSLPGEMVSDSLSGLGLILSGSYTDSSIRPDLGNPATPIPGLSEKVANATLYYERGGFAARVSTRYRSDYRGDIATFGPRGAVFRNLQAETVVDAQISYSFHSGAFEGLTLILQGYNLTDEPLFALEGDQDSRLVKDYQRYGKQFSIGASYKF
ncbi:MAG: TonB-dependent receptor [Puniceicoccaceae bacterium]